MKVIRLSPRLAAIAAIVPPGSRVIDVGTDHAMLPVWLVQTNRSRHVWASDLRAGPLENAARLVRETNTAPRVELRQAAGLTGFSREDGDTVIIAGMGGETMVAILSAAAWLHDGVQLILEPQTKKADLRRWLAENGFVITSERLVRDAERIYPILTAESGPSPAYADAEYLTGRMELIAEDPLLKDYLAILRNRISSAAPFDPQAKALLNDLDTMEKELFR